MNLEHEFYDLQDLEKRWRKYDLTEKDILKHGVSGKLQFSFRIPSGSDTFIHIYAIGNLSDGEVFICDEIAPDCRGSLYNISTVTVNDLFEAESNFIKNGIPSTVDLRLEIPCPNPKCKLPDRATNCNIVHSNFPLMGTDEDSYNNFTGTRSDLIVTRENVLAFEKTSLKAEPVEILPPYLDPDNEFYSVTLDLAVKAWKAIFEDRKYLDSNSAGIAGATYLRSRESGCTELSEKYGIELTDTLAEKIAQVAAGEYSPNRQKWNNFSKQK